MSVVHDAATGTSRPASKKLEREAMAPARARDHHRQAAYTAGKNGEPMPWEGEDDELFDIYNQGSDEREAGDDEPSPRARADASSSSRSRPSLKFDAAEDGAGLLLGLFAYALTLAYIKGGWPGVTSWLGAKFLNKTSATAPSSRNGNSGTGGPGPGGATTWTDPKSGEAYTWLDPHKTGQKDASGRPVGPP